MSPPLSACRPQLSMNPVAPTIIEADYDDPTHRQAIVELIDAYAHDPHGNEQALSEEVREALIPGLRDHPSTRVYLALVEGIAVGLAVCLVGFSTFTARPVLNLHDIVVLPPCRGPMSRYRS